MSLETVITFIIILLVVGVVVAYIFRFFSGPIGPTPSPTPEKPQTDTKTSASFDAKAIAGFIEECYKKTRKLREDFNCYLLRGTLDADKGDVENLLKPEIIESLSYDAARGSRVTTISFIEAGGRVQVEGESSDPDEKPPRPP